MYSRAYMITMDCSFGLGSLVLISAAYRVESPLPPGSRVRRLHIHLVLLRPEGRRGILYYLRTGSTLRLSTLRVHSSILRVLRISYWQHLFVGVGCKLLTFHLVSARSCDFLPPHYRRTRCSLSPYCCNRAVCSTDSGEFVSAHGQK